MPTKHEAKPSTLLASRQHAECFILCIARARPWFNCFKELTYEHLVKAYPFQCISCPSTCSSQVRQYRTISYAITPMSRLILAELTWIHHCLKHIQCFILQYSTPDALLVLYGKYSTHFPFDPLTQSFLSVCVCVCECVCLLYKVKKLSVHLSVCIFGTLITQQCVHQSKQDLLKIKAVSLRITEFIFTSLQNPLLINRSA